MCRKRKISTNTGPHDFLHAIDLNVLHSTVFWVIDSVDGADAPGFVEVRTSSQHTAILKALHTNDPQLGIRLFEELVCGNLIQTLFDLLKITVGTKPKRHRHSNIEAIHRQQTLVLLAC